MVRIDSYYHDCKDLTIRDEKLRSKLIAGSCSSEIISCSFCRSSIVVFLRSEQIKEIGWKTWTSESISKGSTNLTISSTFVTPNHTLENNTYKKYSLIG